MAYLPNIPQSTDKLSVSQGQILGNFQALGPISNSINAADGFNFVKFALPAIPANTVANQMALYTANFGAPAVQELFIVRQNSTARIPITASKISTNTIAGPTQSSGWTYLPSGMLMIWGTATTNPGSSVIVTYSTIAGFPGWTIAGNPFVIRLGAPASSGTPIFITNVSNLNFTAQTMGNVAGNYAFNWFAIGK